MLKKVYIRDKNFPQVQPYKFPYRSQDEKIFKPLKVSGTLAPFLKWNIQRVTGRNKTLPSPFSPFCLWTSIPRVEIQWGKGEKHNQCFVKSELTAGLVEVFREAKYGLVHFPCTSPFFQWKLHGFNS